MTIIILKVEICAADRVTPEEVILQLLIDMKDKVDPKQGRGEFCFIISDFVSIGKAHPLSERFADFPAPKVQKPFKTTQKQGKMRKN